MNSIEQSEENSQDSLINALVELARSLEGKEIPLIIGGGLSLYIRTVYLDKVRSPRYPRKVFQRSTKDIDLFLTSDIIIDPKKIEIIRDSIKSFGYKPKTKYFQFTKEDSSGKTIILDILSAPPVPDEFHRTKFNKPRIKPIGVNNFHAFLVNEAQGLSLGNISLEKKTNNQQFKNIFIPSSYNYIILKLHAFRDRINDKTTEFGRHHAYDIFATVTDMDKSDWDNAMSHLENHKDSAYIKEANGIVKNYFSENTQIGILRLKENEYYNRDKEEYDKYIENFISDLKELFSINEK